MSKTNRTNGALGAALTNGTRRLIKDFLRQECCGQPMQTGYDAVTVHHFEGTTFENAYYAMCDVCGNEETATHDMLKEQVRDEIRRNNEAGVW
jgi:hypothetical protein